MSEEKNDGSSAGEDRRINRDQGLPISHSERFTEFPNFSAERVFPGACVHPAGTHLYPLRQITPQKVCVALAVFSGLIKVNVGRKGKGISVQNCVSGVYVSHIPSLIFLTDAASHWGTFCFLLISVITPGSSSRFAFALPHSA